MTGRHTPNHVGLSWQIVRAISTVVANAFAPQVVIKITPPSKFYLRMPKSEQVAQKFWGGGGGVEIARLGSLWGLGSP